ncbi:GLPGLI family protein [Pedobacter yulinensis]|nr:GLPGLI family protein [Pedobacter yulinensis]
MKNLIITFFAFATLSFGKVAGQSVVANYLISQDIYGTGDLSEKKLATIQSRGYLYRQNNQYIYFERPNYLETYPNGSVEIQTGNNQQYSRALCMDTIQRLSFVDMDSLQRIYRPHIAAKHPLRVNYRQSFEADYFSWIMLPEVREINGLKCQKATMSIRDNLQWIVWVATEVPMQAGVLGVIGIPGLIVEADCVPLKTRYVLQSYSVGTSIPQSVFKPAEFLEKFDEMPALRKANLVPKGPSKIQRQAELSNQ